MKKIIVDGSNVVRQWFHLTGSRPDFQQEARLSERLLGVLARLNHGRDFLVEVYFDGPKRILAHSAGMEVMFSKNKKADDLIVNSVYETVQTYQGEALVITQARGLIERCRQYGSYIKHTWSFLKEMDKGFIEYA